jgi:hypothetical protein
VSVPSSRASHPALEDGTDTGFRNVGLPKFDAGEIPKRNYFYPHVGRIIQEELI